MVHIRHASHILAVRCEPVVDASWQDDEISLLQTHAHPFVLDTPHIKKAFPVKDVSDFLVFMQVLVEEHLHLVLVGGAHLLRRHDDLITISVGAF